MAQVLKPEVRQRIIDEAGRAFALQGYRQTRLQDIAHGAGCATGNLYRYFSDKEALFDAVVPRRTAARFLRLLRARVRGLARADDWTAMTSEASPAAASFLEFLAKERLAMLVLLAGAEGSPLGHIRPLAVREMTRLSVAYVERHGRGRHVSLTVLTQVFRGTVDMIVAILRESPDDDALFANFACFWRYQLAGLQAMLR